MRLTESAGFAESAAAGDKTTFHHFSSHPPTNPHPPNPTHPPTHPHPPTPNQPPLLTPLPTAVRVLVFVCWRLAWVGVWHGLTQAWLVPKQGPTMPGSVSSLPKDLTRRRRRLRIVSVIESTSCLGLPGLSWFVRGRICSPIVVVLTFSGSPFCCNVGLSFAIQSSTA